MTTVMDDDNIRDLTVASDAEAQSRDSSAQELWNHPRHNLYRTLAAMWSFTVLGANSGALGVRIEDISDE